MSRIRPISFQFTFRWPEKLHSLDIEAAVHRIELYVQSGLASDRCASEKGCHPRAESATLDRFGERLAKSPECAQVSGPAFAMHRSAGGTRQRGSYAPGLQGMREPSAVTRRPKNQPVRSLRLRLVAQTALGRRKPGTVWLTALHIRPKPSPDVPASSQLLSSTGAAGPFFLIESMAF